MTFGRRYLRVGDPEVSNVTDAQSSGDDEAAPEFYVSNPGLLVKTAHKIEELIRADDNSPLSNAPYFLQLNDGRFAFGPLRRSLATVGLAQAGRGTHVT